MTANKQAREKKFQEQDRKIGVSDPDKKSLSGKIVSVWITVGNIVMSGVLLLVILYLWACWQTGTPVYAQVPAVLLTCYGFVKLSDWVISRAEPK